MKPAALSILLLVPGAVQEEPRAAGGLRAESGEEHAFVELVAEKPSCYLREPVRLRLRFGLERELLADRAVQPFGRPLEFPAQVEAAWLEELACGVLLDWPPAMGADAGPGSGPQFALGERVLRATRASDVQVRGRSFRVLELDLELVPRCVGELVLAGPLLRFAHATRFRDDVLSERVPLDRRDALVHGAPLALDVLPLPEESRPAGFGGAVGRFDVSVEVDRSEVAVGESFKLAFHVEGRGDLASFEPPALEGLRGFHLRGWTEERGPARRTITYDLSPLQAELDAVPRLAFSYFDPTPPAAYRTLRTPELPLRVVPARDADTEPLPGRRSAPDAAPTLLLPALAVGAPLIVLAWFLLRRRARPSRAETAARRRALDALRDFRSGAAGADGADGAANELPRAFGELLAALLDRPLPAVSGPALGRRLAARGVPDDLARRAAKLFEELEAARYGGRAAPDAGAHARVLVDELERALRAPAT